MPQMLPSHYMLHGNPVSGSGRSASFKGVSINSLFLEFLLVIKAGSLPLAYSRWCFGDHALPFYLEYIAQITFVYVGPVFVV